VWVLYIRWLLKWLKGEMMIDDEMVDCEMVGEMVDGWWWDEMKYLPSHNLPCHDHIISISQSTIIFSWNSLYNDKCDIWSIGEIVDEMVDEMFDEMRDEIIKWSTYHLILPSHLSYQLTISSLLPTYHLILSQVWFVSCYLSQRCLSSGSEMRWHGRLWYRWWDDMVDCETDDEMRW